MYYLFSFLFEFISYNKYIFIIKLYIFIKFYNIINRGYIYRNGLAQYKTYSALILTSSLISKCFILSGNLIG
jgi:hypothetical protein